MSCQKTRGCFKHVNETYLETSVAMGFINTADPIILQLYVEPVQRFRLAARSHGSVLPPETHRERIETYFDPLPFGMCRLRKRGSTARASLCTR